MIKEAEDYSNLDNDLKSVGMLCDYLKSYKYVCQIHLTPEKLLKLVVAKETLTDLHDNVWLMSLHYQYLFCILG